MPEVTTVDSEAYWYRMVGEFPNNIKYSWGKSDMSWIYRCDLEYLGRGTYLLTDIICNGRAYKRKEKLRPRDRKRVKGYPVTIKLLERMKNG